MIGIGLDASTSCIGWSVFNNDKLVNHGMIKTESSMDSWRDRIQFFIPKLQELINKYHPSIFVVEDVPLINKQMITLVQLGAVQGMLLSICAQNNIEIKFVHVNTWRKDIGISDGDKNRDNKKIRSIEKANEIFNLELPCVFTKFGNYNALKSADDEADAILVYASTLDKYRVKRGVGRR